MNQGGRGRCSICLSSARTDIEAAVTAGLSTRLTAERFGVSQAAISRHSRNHPNLSLVAVTPVSASVVEGRDQAGDVFGQAQIADLVLSTFQSLEAAKVSGNSNAVATAHREHRQALDLSAKVQLDAEKLALLQRPAEQVIDLLRTEQWLSTRRKVMDALDEPRFLDARLAIATALLGLEGPAHSAEWANRDFLPPTLAERVVHAVDPLFTDQASEEIVVD